MKQPYKIKNIISLSIVLFMIVFSSCTQDELDMNQDQQENNISSNEFYISFKVGMSDGYNTRGTTTPDGGSSDDEDSTDLLKNGFAYEQKIREASIYFYHERNENDKSKNELLHWISTDELKLDGPDASGNYTFISKLSLEDLKFLIGNKVNVYVIGNRENLDIKKYPTENLILEAKIDVPISSITIGSSFFPVFRGMIPPPFIFVNYEKYSIDLTKIKSIDQNDILDIANKLFNKAYIVNGKKIGNIWEISNDIPDSERLYYEGAGPLWLERNMARIDYYIGDAKVPNYHQIYELKNFKALVGLESKKVYCKNKLFLRVLGVQCFNISKVANGFRHIAEGNDSKGLRENGKIKEFGIENGNPNYGPSNTDYNWIYDYDWEEKDKLKISEDQLFIDKNDYFYSQPQNNNGKWDVDIAGWLTATQLQFVQTNWRELISPVGRTDGYTPIFFLPENTLPSVEKMILPLATGLVFRMAIYGKTNTDSELEDTNKVKVEDYDLHGTEIETTPIDENGHVIKEPLRILMKDDTYLDVKYYQGNVSELNSASRYYIDYVYLIEHNRNNNSVSSGSGTASDLLPMQIGVVRNNIYQIRINSINGLPNAKESDNLSLGIDIKVRPWTVRKNEFSW